MRYDFKEIITQLENYKEKIEYQIHPKITTLEGYFHCKIKEDYNGGIYFMICYSIQGKRFKNGFIYEQDFNKLKKYLSTINIKMFNNIKSHL